MSGAGAGWAVVVPVKTLPQAKTRLSVDTPQDRRGLALAFALDTVAAARECDRVAAVVVVTDDADVRVAVSALGAEVVDDGTDGLNAAVDRGAAHVRATYPALAVAALTGDLPALQPHELARALDAAATVPRGFVADAAGTGTTLLTALPDVDLDPRFGPRSRAAHAVSGAVALEPGLVPGLRRDVDTTVDLWDAARLGLGPATAALLDAT
jgi:2-phospho-L-lactate/phosphoenolpyruvate guanylyltransferase